MSAGKPKNLLRTSLYLLGVAIYRLGLARAVINLSKKRVRALLYHAVEDENSNPFTVGLGVSVTPETFNSNLDYFKKFYNVIPVSQLEAAGLPDNPMVITFDDGYLSVFENAAPALKSREMSACIYLISRAVRGELVWVNLVNYVLEKEPARTAVVLKQFPEFEIVELDAVIGYLQGAANPTQISKVYNALMEEFSELKGSSLYASADQIKQMSTHGMEFGFHTADHFNLSNCSVDELTVQLDPTEVSNLITNNTFAYPFGYYSEDAITQLKKKDYDAVMTVGNNNKQYFDRHLDRTEVFTANPAAVFAQLEVVEPIVSWLRNKLLRSPAQTTAYEISAPQNAKTPH